MDEKYDRLFGASTSIYPGEDPNPLFHGACLRLIKKDRNKFKRMLNQTHQAISCCTGAQGWIRTAKM